MVITFILVNPAIPENIGASVRAMNTMGFRDLRLVNPCEYLNEKAKMLAHGSHQILEKASLFPSFNEAIKDVDFVIGTTAKKRSAKEDYYPVEKLSDYLEKKGDTISTVAIVFGREESGLTNEEIRLCDLVTSIPMHKAYPSLNLSQAVMIYAYLLSAFYEREGNYQKDSLSPPSYPPLKEKVVKILDQTNIKKNPTLYNRILERLALLEEVDIHLLHSITEELLVLIADNQADS